MLSKISPLIDIDRLSRESDSHDLRKYVAKSVPLLRRQANVEPTNIWQRNIPVQGYPLNMNNSMATLSFVNLSGVDLIPRDASRDGFNINGEISSRLGYPR